MRNASLVFLLVAIATVLADKIIRKQGITTKVRGHSGKISVYKDNNESDGITLMFDAIQEVNSDGQEIDTSRTYKNFARLDFKFSDLEDKNYPETNVTVTQFNFMAEIPHGGNTAQLKSYIYVFTSEGQIRVDNETVTVKPGMMKFDVMIENWKFCKNCSVKGKQEDGMYLDFSIEVKGQGAAKKTVEGKVEEYSLGENSTLIVPSQVIYDGGRTKDMPPNYPKYTKQGERDVFTFRFERFENTALYDPLVDVTGNDTTPTNTDTDMKEGDVNVKIRGQSGKMSLMRAQSKLDIEFDNLQEVMANGNPVSDKKHRFNTFANQEFSFSPIVEGKYPNTELVTQETTFSASLTNNANLMVSVYVFKSEGNINNGDETIMVKKGNIKFDVVITGWTFCAESMCGNDQGEYLDFEIVMKGKDKPKKEANKAKMGDKYEFGSAAVVLSSKVKIDGLVPQDMSAGYPMLETKGSKDVFKFRFPKFTRNVTYDPTISMESMTPPPSRASVAALPMSLLYVLLLIYVFEA